MKRNILDMLLSLLEQKVEDEEESYFLDVEVNPREILRLNLEEQKDYIIYHIAPWYIRFYASWEMAGKEIKLLFIDYDNFRNDNLRTVKEIFEFCKICFSDQEIKEAITKSNEGRKKLHFNKGISGRGTDFFGEKHKEHIKKLIKPFDGLKIFKEVV